ELLGEKSPRPRNRWFLGAVPSPCFGMCLVAIPVASAAAVTATAATVAAASTAAAVAATATAAATFGLGTRFMHGQPPPFNLLSIQRIDCLLRFLVVAHFNEPEPLRAAGLAVHDDLSRCHRSMRLEHLTQLVVGRAVLEVSDVQPLAHLGLQKTGAA